MASESAYEHPIDYEVHRVGGWIVVAWGVLIAIGDFATGYPESPVQMMAEAMVPLGLVLLGCALMRPRGKTRTWLVRGWLTSMAALAALMALAFVQ